jgi:hypothetical protein
MSIGFHSLLHGRNPRSQLNVRFWQAQEFSLKVFKQKDARGLLHDELQEQRDLRVWPYGHGNHAFWHDDGY